MKQDKRKKVWGLCGRVLLLLCLILPIVTGIAMADFGPKQSITIQLKNAPRGAYVIALLRTDRSWNGDEKQDDAKSYPDAMRTAMEELLKHGIDGWSLHTNPLLKYPFLDSKSGDEYYFGYRVPEYFRVVIIEEDGAIHLSDSVGKSKYNAVFEYDVATGKIAEKKAESIKRYASNVLRCYLLTLITEGLVLCLFRLYDRKKNWLHFLIINTITQVVLNWILVTEEWYHGGGLGMVAMLFLAEIGVTVAEAIYYAIFLRRKNEEKCTGRSIGYAIVANLASVHFGLFTMIFMIW